MSLSNFSETSKSIYLKGLFNYGYILFVCITAISASASGDNNNEPSAKTAEKEVTKNIATLNGIASEIKKYRKKWISYEISDYEIEM